MPHQFEVEDAAGNQPGLLLLSEVDGPAKIHIDWKWLRNGPCYASKLKLRSSLPNIAWWSCHQMQSYNVGGNRTAP